MDSNGHILPVFNCSGDTKNLEYHNKNFSEWPAIGHLGKKKKKKKCRQTRQVQGGLLEMCPQKGVECCQSHSTNRAKLTAQHDERGQVTSISVSSHTEQGGGH